MVFDSMQTMFLEALEDYPEYAELLHLMNSTPVDKETDLRAIGVLHDLDQGHEEFALEGAVA
ncbi:hypothetical protein QVA66_09165 [Staphylococcus chromogenes]|nr:hypothetical protein [Staphylococcus chromogenes]